MKGLKGELFLCTKLIKPTTARETIWITGFLEKMQSAHHYGVIFIRAGAGYGKSTMLSKYFTESDQAYCWMTLAEEDAELPVCLKNLLLSVQGGHPETVLTLILDQRAHSVGSGQIEPRSGSLPNDAVKDGRAPIDQHLQVHHPRVGGGGIDQAGDHRDGPA